MLILGTCSIVVPSGRIELGKEYLFIDLHFLLGAVLALGTAMSDGVVTRVEGVLLLSGYGVYVAYLMAEGRSEAEVDERVEGLPTTPSGNRLAPKDLMLLVLTGAAIFVAGDRTVYALRAVADALAISPAIASVTILSIGTTLPELAVSVTAARRGLTTMAVGNILGSTIFNSLAVTGAAATLGGVAVPAALLHFALPFMAGSALLFYLLTQDKRISRWEGLLFLVLFALFVVKVANIG